MSLFYHKSLGKEAMWLVLVGIFHTISYGNPTAEFLQEHVQLTYESTGHLHVSGTYLIRNPKQGQMRILYPVPPLGPYDSAVSICLSTNTPLPLTTDAKGLRTQTCGADLDTSLHLWGYRQKPQTDTLLYILRSTQAWGKPLLFSHIEFQAPQTQSFGDFSYPPDSTRVHGANQHWYWTFQNFMPDRDWWVVRIPNP